MNRRRVFAAGFAAGIAVAVAAGMVWPGAGGTATKPVAAEGAPTPELGWLPADPVAALGPIEDQFRGMDVTMWEIGYRFTELYHAGQDRNWGYVDYQFEKIAHALGFGLERRPARADSAQAFIEEVLPAVEPLIRAHDPESFMRGMEQLRAGCMQCHVAEDVPHFTVVFPAARSSSIGLPGDDPIDW